jgi:hypothetical protein
MTRRGLAHALTIGVVGAAVGFTGSAARLLSAASPCAAAAYGGRVALVVEHGDGQVTGLCVGFDGASISGQQILQASGLEYATAGYGALGDAVCQIADEPAAYSSCLPSSGSYWVLFVSRQGSAWQVASGGVSTETFASGDAEGFRYDPQDGPDPPPASPVGICAAALGGSTATASGTAGEGAPGSGRGSASAAPQPSASESPPSASATPGVGATGPAAGVIAPADASGSSTAGAAPKTVPPSAPSPSLIVVAAVLGALTGLLVVQLALRRRRT